MKGAAAGAISIVVVMISGRHSRARRH